ncbi:MAG: two-component sensor histidine kinase [Flavobacteriales bacterium CG_4_9_14_3_um_filter_40_17]|nr:MAG: two-component sensor histidine kinase [Flavobacteriales bacterium CG_4_9_14_3_um_filter_40_17]
MIYKRFSLRLRIFVSMIVLVLAAFVLIAIVTIIQYKEEVSDYHKDRLERKEEAIKENINYVIRTTTFEVVTNQIPLIFKDKIFEIANIHNLQINLYDLEGKLLKSSKESFSIDSIQQIIPPDVLKKLINNPDKRYVDKIIDGKRVFQSSYSYLTDTKFKPLAILNIPYLEEEDFIAREHYDFLARLGQVYLFMLIIAILFAYLISTYITKSLKTISDKMYRVRIGERNQKIEVRHAGEEIHNLVSAYNSMVDQLEESAAKLAAGEREHAWREMAKQVAHEIKNPLTPMRLSVQSFEYRFNPEDPDVKEKTIDFCRSLIQQIDTMNAIASAFSNFSNMPAQNSELINMAKVVKLALDIFSEDYIRFQIDSDNIPIKFDRTQMIRIVTNLVKNGTQAVSEINQPKILVQIQEKQDAVILTVSDNGIGISELNRDRVFEPQFTTKTSGMGLGLAMVKTIIENYGGTISFVSKPEKGTVFTVVLPKTQ